MRGKAGATRRLALALAFALNCGACASRSPARPEPAPLNVMSFNIRYGTAPDSTNAWPLRRELLFDVIRFQDAQILSVQEALRSQIDEIRRELSQYAELGVGRDDGRQAGEYSAILYDAKRLAPLEHGDFWFSATPEVVASKTWGNNITRICTWARFRDLATGRAFYVYNVHWDHESQPSRDSSAVLLLRRIAAREHRTDPVIVTGDFNAGETNSAFRTLLAGASRVAGSPRLIDTFRSTNPSAGAVGTFHDFRGGTSGEKIDAVLASAEWQVLRAAIIRTADRGRYPSDHYPVTARILLR